MADHGADDADAIDEFRRLGVSDDALAEMEESKADDERADDAFEIWPEHLPALELFIAAMTQMRVNHFSGLPIGLDYAGLAVAARARRTRLTPALFEDVQAIEIAYVRERRRQAAERERARQ